MKHDQLANELEAVAGKALGWIDNVLSQPIDVESSALLRAQASAAQTALTTQVRADALRLQAARHDKALEELIALIRQKEKLVPSPQGHLPSPL